MNMKDLLVAWNDFCKDKQEAIAPIVVPVAQPNTTQKPVVPQPNQPQQPQKPIATTNQPAKVDPAALAKAAQKLAAIPAAKQALGDLAKAAGIQPTIVNQQGQVIKQATEIEGETIEEASSEENLESSALSEIISTTKHQLQSEIEAEKNNPNKIDKFISSVFNKNALDKDSIYSFQINISEKSFVVNFDRFNAVDNPIIQKEVKKMLNEEVSQSEQDFKKAINDYIGNIIQTIIQKTTEVSKNHKYLVGGMPLIKNIHPINQFSMAFAYGTNAAISYNVIIKEIK